MKVSDIITELSELERKRDEVNSALISTPPGEAKDVLSRALVEYQKRVDTFLNAEFEPVATVIYLTVTPNTLSLGVNDTQQLDVVATLSDGTTKNVTNNKRAVMLFRDFDQLHNNTGFITSVDISGYTGEESTFEIVKTSNGFDVDDDKNTQGLQVAPTGNPNEYQVIDLNGNPMGIKFVTNGAEIVGDNWLIHIYWVNTGTVYSVDNPAVAEVSETGLVTAVGGGTANVIVRNGTQEVLIPVTVIDTEPPEPPQINSILAIENGAEIFFDPSVSPDAASYNVYVDGTLHMTNVTDTPVTIQLAGDGVTAHTITMTAVDYSGNESEHSNAMDVIPLPTL